LCSTRRSGSSDGPSGSPSRFAGRSSSSAGASAGQAARSVGDLAAGLVGIVAALGYGMPRLVEGSMWSGMPAMAAAVASIGLLVLGTYHAIRATPGWWRVLAVPVAFALLQFLLMPAAFGTAGVHGVRTPLSRDPLRGVSTVSFAASDGIELQAWYTASRNGAAVVAGIVRSQLL
jgi:hypothetical protein